MVVFSSPAPFSREQTTNARLSLSFRSKSLSSYAFIIMPQRKSAYAPSALIRFCLNFCREGFFFHRTALNSAVKRNHRKEIRAHKSITLFAVGSERTHAHLRIKMGFANVWGSHPKDNAKGGRAWYAGDVLFPNETREIFFSLFCAFFFFCAAAETP